VSTRGLGIYWFDEAGLIVEHHAYREQHTFDGQLAGDARFDLAPPPPAAPEVHLAQDTPGESAGANWIARFDPDSGARGGVGGGSGRCISQTACQSRRG
jgi:hypothetical protein